jgi:hypothetical protein
MERNETFDKFFELKCKQLLCRLWLMAFAKPGYVNDEFGLCMKHMEVQAKQEAINDELIKLLTEHKSDFENTEMKDLEAYGKEYKVSMEKQKEFAKELLGQEWTIEELMEKVEKRY